MGEHHVYAKNVTLALLTTLLLAGCSVTNKRDNPFPKEDEFRLATSKPAPEAVIKAQGKMVETWELEGPFPDQIGRIPMQRAEDAWDSMLIRAANNSRKLVATVGMDCAAREHGRFMLENELEFPAADLEDFIHRRCGVGAGNVMTRYYTWDLEEGQTLTMDNLNPDFEKKQFGKSIKEIEKSVEDGEVGIWYGEKNNKGLLLITAGRNEILFEPIATNPSPGESVTLTGQLQRKADYIYGVVTAGDFGHEQCATDTSLDLPKFEITCPTLDTDEEVIFTIYTRRRGALLSNAIYSQAVRPKAPKPEATTTSEVEAEPVAATDGEVADGGEGAEPGEEVAEAPAQAQTEKVIFTTSPLKQKLLEAESSIEATTPEERATALVNVARAEAGLEPLKLSAKQSQSAKKTAPHLLSASNEQDDEKTNLLSMGLLAGWDVEGSIINGSIMINQSVSNDLVDVIARALEQPGGRSTLLEEESAVISFGLHEEGERLAIVTLTHDFLPTQSHASRAKAVTRSIARARELKGKKPFVRSKKLRGTAGRYADRVRAGKISFEKAAEGLAKKTAESYNSNVRILTLYTHDLEDLEFHKELMKAKAPEGVVMVAPFTPEGHPWTLYGVVIVVPDKKLR